MGFINKSGWIDHVSFLWISVSVISWQAKMFWQEKNLEIFTCREFTSEEKIHDQSSPTQASAVTPWTPWTAVCWRATTARRTGITFAGAYRCQSSGEARRGWMCVEAFDVMRSPAFTEQAWRSVKWAGDAFLEHEVAGRRSVVWRIIRWAQFLRSSECTSCAPHLDRPSSTPPGRISSVR